MLCAMMLNSGIPHQTVVSGSNFFFFFFFFFGQVSIWLLFLAVLHTMEMINTLGEILPTARAACDG